MKIAIASLQCESNTLSPIPTTLSAFDIAYGTDMYEKIHVVDMLEDAGAEVIPTLYAHGLPGGPVRKEDYLKLAMGIVDALPEKGLDGVWLYLHGAMYVQDIGSGETWLLQRIREKIGFDVPISVGMDFHANNTDEMIGLCNAICGFRTAPHIDRIETERKAMSMLLSCVKKRILPHPRMARANVVIPGDAVQTSLPPLNAIMAKADEMEKAEGMLCAQVFNGQPWVDSPYMGPNMIVTHESDERLAQECADMLAKMFYDARHDFRFLIEAVSPAEAVRLAMEAKEKQVFISDSGDNTTAGAAGDNAFMLNLLCSMGAKKALLAGIMDKAAVDICYRSAIGDTLTLTLGGSLSGNSEKAVVTGKLIHIGDILGYAGDNAGRSATLDCGDITVIVTENRAAITSREIFASIDMDFQPYKIIVVKLGYLFPDLAEIAERSILAFTPGASTERLEDMGMKHIRRPMFPLDDNF